MLTSRKLGSGLVVLAVLFSPLGVVQAASAPSNTTCTGGAIAAGTYRSLTIAGNCTLPSSGVVTVLGNVTVEPKAVFDAQTLATLNVFGNVNVGRGAIAVIGCSPEASPSCTSTTSDRIAGNVSASQPLAVIVHSTTLRGSLSVQGGGGGVNCDVNPALAAIEGFPSPLFTDFEDNQIGGQVSVSNMESCYFAIIRDNVSGGVSITHNTFSDPDSTEIVNNTVSGNLACSGNSPAAQFGDADPLPNTVRGSKTGECAKL